MKIKIGRKTIGTGQPVFIVAELSANHNMDFKIAVRTLKAMKAAGADAVKIQTYTPDTITINCARPAFKIQHGTLWDGQTLYSLYKKAYTPWEWQPKLKKLAEKLGLIFFSTPFDHTAVDFLEKMKVPAYKIASFEITDIPLIEYAASKGKPMFLATGVARLADIEEAVEACRRVKNRKLIILKCTSSYPAPYEDANLAVMADLARRFGVVTGLSDHTPGIAAPIAAAALGAAVIEKHFILDRKLGGPDAAFSLEPAEFKAMADGVRAAEKALGRVTYSLSSKALKNRKFSRSLFVVEDIKKGEALTGKNIRSIRPGDGMPPKHFHEVLGKKASRNLKRGTPLKSNMIARK
ncbi:MAG: pseudaminic acid synthase [Elusimicrobia bacterium RIFOXYA12_FULL_51_18]|nr:MAG: pseudaminic acid synthase [Elusimicrobia bacterium RIFOXYA12_FULL_51_18]OGS32885.1 MAG: pseudaminic acid synthase [Elusimicrobia bacterium RIFOXYA2_FULL_53_38]